MTKKQSDKSEKLPQVLKLTEYYLMLEFISLGLWRSTNLAKACNVNIDSISDWKKRPEAQAAYREAVKSVMKKRKAIGDPEKLMKELQLEVDVDRLDITTAGLPIFGGKSVSTDNSHT